MQESAVVATVLCVIYMIVYTSACTEKQRRKGILMKNSKRLQEQWYGGTMQTSFQL